MFINYKWDVYFSFLFWSIQIPLSKTEGYKFYLAEIYLYIPERKQNRSIIYQLSKSTYSTKLETHTFYSLIHSYKQIWIFISYNMNWNWKLIKEKEKMSSRWRTLKEDHPISFMRRGERRGMGSVSHQNHLLEIPFLW